MLHRIVHIFVFNEKGEIKMTGHYKTSSTTSKAMAKLIVRKDIRKKEKAKMLEILRIRMKYNPF